MKTSELSFRVYKPTKSKTGAALQLNPSHTYSCVFLEITSQSKEDSGGDKNKEFDWNNKIVMKLGITDILSLIDILELVRTSTYKELVRCQGEEFDKWMGDMAAANKGNLVSLFHVDPNKGTNSALNVKPNSHKYGGGFNIQVSKQIEKDKNLSHRVNINAPETLGILYTLEKFLANTSSIKNLPKDVEVQEVQL